MSEKNDIIAKAKIRTSKVGFQFNTVKSTKDLIQDIIEEADRLKAENEELQSGYDRMNLLRSAYQTQRNECMISMKHKNGEIIGLEAQNEELVLVLKGVADCPNAMDCCVEEATKALDKAKNK